MIPFRFPAKFLFSLILALALVHPVFAEDLDGSLEALRKKIAAKEAERTQPQQGERSQLSLQIKMLQGLIARGDYERAAQMLGNIGGYGMPPDLQDEWIQVADLLGKEMERRQAESAEKWRAEVDELVTETKKACLEAKSSADLDPMLVRCAALQMRREQPSNILSERTARKLAGTAATLTAWSNYLDFRDAGNIKRANETLRSLRTNESVFPVLTAQEIDARFLTDDAEPVNIRTALTKVFEGVKSPDDIPAALERLKTYAANPMNPELGNLRNEQKRLENTLLAWETVKKGNYDDAVKALEKAVNSGGNDDAQRYYEPLRDQISSKIMQEKVQKWSKLPQNPDEDPASYLERILDELQTKSDYATMIEVMKFSNQINRGAQTGTFGKDIIAVDQLLAGQRFEKAGDDLAAVTNYRLVVGSTPGKYIPIAQAEEALKELKEKNPEAFKSYEGAIMEEIRALRTQIQMLMGRMSGARPYPPGYPYPGQ